MGTGRESKSSQDKTSAQLLAKARWEAAIQSVISSSQLDDCFNQKKSSVAKTKGLNNSVFNFWAESYRQSLYAKGCRDAHYDAKHLYYSSKKQDECEITFSAGIIFIGQGAQKKKLHAPISIQWVELPDKNNKNKTKFYVRHPSDRFAYHSYLAAGNRVLAAGELRTDDGKIIYLSNKTGHYAISEEYFRRSVKRMPRDIFSPLAEFKIYRKNYIFSTKDRGYFLKTHPADFLACVLNIDVSSFEFKRTVFGHQIEFSPEQPYARLEQYAKVLSDIGIKIRLEKPLIRDGDIVVPAEIFLVGYLDHITDCLKKHIDTKNLAATKVESECKESKGFGCRIS